MKSSTLLLISYDSSLTKLQLSIDVLSLFKSLLYIIRNHEFLYISFKELSSSLFRTYRKEAIVTFINVSSLSRIRASRKESRLKRKFEKTCEVIKSLFILSSSLLSFLKHHIKFLYVIVCWSQSLWTCTLSEQFFNKA